jgi:hypothetical protein
MRLLDSNFTDLQTQRLSRIDEELKECQEASRTFLLFIQDLPGFEFSEKNTTCQYLSAFVLTGTQDHFITLNSTIQHDPSNFTITLCKPFSNLSNEQLTKTRSKFESLRSICSDYYRSQFGSIFEPR